MHVAEVPDSDNILPNEAKGNDLLAAGDPNAPHTSYRPPQFQQRPALLRD